MAIQTMVLDPNAVSYTDDQIVGKINSATANITRASAVSAAARPIADSEIVTAKIAAGAIKAKLAAEADGNKLTASELAAAAAVAATQIAAGQAKASLDAMADTARGYIKTNPTSGQFKVVSIERRSDGKQQTSFDDVAV